MLSPEILEYLTRRLRNVKQNKSLCNNMDSQLWRKPFFILYSRAEVSNGHVMGFAFQVCVYRRRQGKYAALSSRAESILEDGYLRCTQVNQVRAGIWALCAVPLAVVGSPGGRNADDQSVSGLPSPEPLAVSARRGSPRTQPIEKPLNLQRNELSLPAHTNDTQQTTLCCTRYHRTGT